MFSKAASDFTKLVEYTFIIGVPFGKIKETVISDSPAPEVLLCIPEEKSASVQELEFIFPTGFRFSYSDETPKFYSIALTNEKGGRSYTYILKIFEKVEIHDHDKNSDILIRAPLAICIRSMVCDTEAFKELLHEVYQIITYSFDEEGKGGTYKPVSGIQLNHYRRVELLNYFLFLNSLLKPPSHTLMTLHLRFSSIDLYFSSKYEIPCNLNDNNIKILFSCLEISIVIKLWFSILCEKHVIIIANQSFLLYSICEALMKLIFPFKWLHVYIPVLPISLLDLLEAPTPYIMGVLSSCADMSGLEETFPSHVICDVDSCQISGYKDTSYLPQNEESTLRKKLQLIKNPEIFEIEEIISKPGNRTVSEDINPDLTFSANVQKIFLRIIRKCLENYKKDFIKPGIGYEKKFIFDEEKFLESFTCEEYKNVWNKIIQTTAFENFILLNNNKDDSYTRIFNNILKYSQDDLKKRTFANAFKIEITLPKDNIRNISEKLKEKKNIEEKEIEETISDYFSILTQMDTSISIQNEVALPVALPLPLGIKHTPVSKKNVTAAFSISSNKKIKKRTRTQSYDLSFLENFAEIKKGNHKVKDSLLQQSLRCSGTNFCMRILKQEEDLFLFYDNEKNKIFRKGFFSFACNALKIFSSQDTNLIDIVLREDLLMEIFKKHSEVRLPEKDSSNIIKLNAMNDSNNNDIIEENEADESDMRMSHRSIVRVTKTTSSKSFGKLNFNSMFEDIEDDDKYFTFNSSVKTFQLYLLFAYYLEDLKNMSLVSIDKEKLTDKILDFYHNAYILDKNEFPLYRYYQLINTLELKRLAKISFGTNCKCLHDLVKDKIAQLNKKYAALTIKAMRDEDITHHHNFSITPREAGLSNKFSPVLTHRRATGNEEDMKKDSTLFWKNSTPKIESSSTYERNARLAKLHSVKEKGGGGDSIQYLIAMRNQMKQEIRKKKIEKKLKNSSTDSPFTEVFTDGGKSERCVTNQEQQAIITVSTSSPIDSSKLSENNSPKYLNTLSTFGEKNSKRPSQEEWNFSKPVHMNKFQKVYKKSDALQLIDEIAQRVIYILTNFNLCKCKFPYEKFFSDVEKSNEMEKLKDCVACLQRVNIGKFCDIKEKLTFWMNAFNFLSLFAIIDRKCVFTLFKEWQLFLKNALFNIGGYDMSLYEIENKILGGVNFHGEEIKHQNELTKKFAIAGSKLLAYLVHFGLFLPSNSFPHLKIYTVGKVQEMLKENAIEYIKANATYNTYIQTLTVPEYLILIDPKFVSEGFKVHQDLLSPELFDCLINKKYKSIDVVTMSWITNFSDM